MKKILYPTTTESTRTNGWIVLGHDIENRFTNPSKEGLLLSGFCNQNEEVVVIDNTSVDNIEVFSQEILNKCLFICHNADHEATWGTATGFLPMRFGCTMVNSRRLKAGEDGFKNDIISTIINYLGVDDVPSFMNKDIRNTFKDCTFFDADQVLYNAGDTIRLKALYQAQMEEANRQGRVFELNSLRSRLIPVLAEGEVTGIGHDSDKWIKIAKEREIKANNICQELNERLEKQYGVNTSLINPLLRKKLESKEKKQTKNQERSIKLKAQLKNLEEKNKTHLKSYRLVQEQLNKIIVSQETPTDSSVTETGINWGSQKQVIAVMESLGMPLPLGKDKDRRVIPSVKKEARNEWFTNYPASPFIDFMKSYDTYKKTIHNVNSFGEKWVDKYVKNGRVYTVFNQTGAATGRFTTGDKNNDKANMGQIPKPEEYRECFTADSGRGIITIDFRNCEGILMISLSGDMNMKTISDMPDSHSYLGTLCWRNVYKDRFVKTNDPKWEILSKTYEMNQTTPEKKKERDIFKNSGGLFPVAYGIASSKVSRAASVADKEGQIFIDTIKGQIPEVIKFLDSKSEEATTTGYVTHNTRTNSRRGFTPVLDSLHYGWPLDKSQKIEVEMAARNSPIQGEMKFVPC